jgi:hypothetical protein
MKNLSNYIYEVQTMGTYRGYGIKGVYTETQAENLFKEALKEANLEDEFYELFDSSDQKLMRQLVKTYLINLTTIMDFKIDSQWLQTTQDISQAHNLVRFYDYSIKRLQAPQITLKYIGKDTVLLKRGDVLGTFEGYDIINMEATRYLEYGDIKHFHVGKFQKMDGLTILDSGSQVVSVKAKTLKAVDDKEVYLTLNDEDKASNMTKNITKYVSGGAIRDFSLDNYSTNLYIVDKDKQFGLYEQTQDKTNFKVEFLETDGLNTVLATEGIDVNKIKWSSSFEAKFEFAKVGFLGDNGDTLESLRDYAPLVSTTKGFANSLKDYKALTSVITQFYDTNPFKEEGQGESKIYKIADVNIETVLKIEGVNYTLPRFNYDEVKKLQGILDGKYPDWYLLEMVARDALKISTTNFKFQNNSVAGVNVTLDKTEVAIEPQCCSIMIPYVRMKKKEGVDNISKLLDAERLLVDKETRDFKSWNTTLHYYPANEILLDIEVELMLNKEITQGVELETAIKEIFKSYEYKIGMKVPTPEILVRLSNLRVRDVKLGEVNAVVMANAPTEAVYQAGKDSYYKINPIIKYKVW